MGFDDGSIVFDHPNFTYNAGDIVRGNIVFDQQKVKTFRGLYVKIKGYCDVRWTTRHSRTTNNRTEHYTVEHTSHETYIEQKVYLIGGKDGEVHLQPGHYEYPFVCLLPPHCPSSFEGSNGHVRYEVKAVIDRSFKFDQEKKAQFTVINVKDLNRDPYCKEPMVFEFEESYCCWCMSAGSCVVTARLPQSGYCPGQTINIELNCANNSNVEISLIKFEVIENRSFTATHHPDTRHEDTVIAKLKKGPIPGNTTRNWMLEMDIPQIDLYNLESCQYIDVRHDFKVVVSPSGCHSDTEGTRRLVLGHIPLREFEGPPPNPHEIAQPVAPSLAQYPGGSPGYPNTAPFPANPPYPGATVYPGANLPYPGVSPPYPGANPPYPGANPFPSPLPGVSPYPVGSDPKPAQPGFIVDNPASPLLPSNPYPNNHPVVSPYATASAPPPGTPDNEGKFESKAKWRNNVLLRNLKPERSGSSSSKRNRLYYYSFYFKDVKQLKGPLTMLKDSLISGKMPKLSDFTDYKIYRQKNTVQSQSNSFSFLSPRSPSERVFPRPTTITTPFTLSMPSQSAPIIPQYESVLPFSKSVPIPFSESELEPPPYTETASRCPFNAEDSTNQIVKTARKLEESLSVLDYLKTKKANIENVDVESNSKDMFLLSLLPELNAMSTRQLRVFKRRVMDLIEEIMEATPTTSTPNDSSQIHFYYESVIPEVEGEIVDTMKKVLTE